MTLRRSFRQALWLLSDGATGANDEELRSDGADGANTEEAGTI